MSASAAASPYGPRPMAEVNPGLLSDVQNNVIWECVRIRLARHASQSEVGRAAGVTRQDINKWEEGRWLNDWRDPPRGVRNPSKADAIIAAYAALGRVAPRTIWARAVRQEGLPAGSPKSVYLRRRDIRRD